MFTTGTKMSSVHRPLKPARCTIRTMETILRTTGSAPSAKSANRRVYMVVGEIPNHRTNMRLEPALFQ